MILRIVRMEFHAGKAEEFQSVFNASKGKIRAFPGCVQLQLHQDAGSPNVFYTYSRWQTAEDLENYRKSELFRSTWTGAKQHFAAKPQAFSLVLLDEVEPLINNG